MASKATSESINVINKNLNATGGVRGDVQTNEFWDNFGQSNRASNNVSRSQSNTFDQNVEKQAVESKSSDWNEDWGSEWGTESDTGKSGKVKKAPQKTQKQDSWGEFEDWLSEEKATAKKD